MKKSRKKGRRRASAKNGCTSEMAEAYSILVQSFGRKVAVFEQYIKCEEKLLRRIRIRFLPGQIDSFWP